MGRKGVGDKTGIEWTDCTFNAWIGCTAISPACALCYAKTLVERWGGDFSERRRTSPANWKLPVRWNKAAASAGVRRKVFCSSLADVFDNQVPDEWRTDLWALIRDTPNLTWQLLTKRPQNIAKMLPDDWSMTHYGHVWLGTTAENQAHYDLRWAHLSKIPALVHFISYEPALGPLDIRGRLLPDWVIAGGESGPGTRPAHPDWFRGVRDHCAETGVAFFFKQWGDWASAKGLPGHLKIGHVFDDGFQMIRTGKKRAGSLLDGREHKEFPTLE
jgi:protein gp37